MIDYSLVPSVAILDAADAIHQRYPEELFGAVGTEAQLLAIEVAAPHIARRARIAEIRAIADWLDAEAHRDFLDADQRPYAADRLRERADEMEAARDA